MADLVDDIKNRLDISDVISQYVQLKKTGRNFKGLCPFHSEKTSSFVVSSEKQIFHCFGCNKGGDIFTFIQEIEGVEFAEALQILADRAGVKIESISKVLKKEGKSEKDDYFKSHDLALEFYKKQLFKTHDGEKVLEYLYKRGLKDETIREFGLGYAPDQYDALYPYLLEKGIRKDVLLKAGFVSSKGIGLDTVYDKFRGRLMFPIFDYLGRVCGFGGRALKADQAPKYLNSPENVIYSKSKVLYGLYHSKKYVKEKDRVILVEGYFDVILPYQSGIKNIAAVSGTALTEEQINVIKRLTSNITTCFDLDGAGFEATKRSYFLLQNKDIMIKMVNGFKGKDPADFILEGGDFNEFVEKASDFVSIYIEKLVKDNDVLTFDGRRNVIKEMLPLCKAMSPSVKDFYVRELAFKLNMDEKFLYDEIDNFKLPADHPARLAASSNFESGANAVPVGEIILSIVLEYPNLFEKFKNLIDENDFDEDVKAIYKLLLDQYNSARTCLEGWSFDGRFSAQVREKINVMLLYAEEKYCKVSEEGLGIEIEKLVDKFKRMRRSKCLNDLHLQIAEAEKLQQKERLIELLKEQQKLLSE